MPAVPGGVGQNGVVDGLADEALVELGALAGVVPGDAVAVAPVLVLVPALALLGLLARMIGAVVVDEIGMIAGKQDRLIVVLDADDIIGLG